MVGLIVLFVFLAGWVYGARLMLAYRMTRMECTKGHAGYICRQVYDGRCAAPAGELRDRTLKDASIALGVGLAWPVLILAHLLTVTTPPTPGEAKRTIREQERRIAEQNADIERLIRENGLR